MEGKDEAVLIAMIAILSTRTMARASGMITIQRCYRLKLQGWYPQLYVKETMRMWAKAKGLRVAVMGHGDNIM